GSGGGSTVPPPPPPAPHGGLPRVRFPYEEMRAGEHPEWKKSAFLLLRDVRNALAHGSPPGSRRSRQVLQSPDRLRSQLEKSFQRLLENER
ncbi:MAG: hypothetical protein OXC31_09415, partial [Spirochaetaceae bacterium]|nr:hypothetical protein [Spirochaetaceae bacterium]